MEEKEREAIRQKAKEIMDNFAKELDKIKEIAESCVEREEDRRHEDEGKLPDTDFRKRLFENASSKDDECIVAEKGGWI